MINYTNCLVSILHYYKIDEHGPIKWDNMVIVTGNNNLAISKGVYQVANHFIRGD